MANAGLPDNGNFLIAIDDEQPLLDVIARVAGDLKIKAWTTTNATAFKAKVQEQKPSIVMLDLQMPDADGVEILRFLFEQQCEAHIVLASGMDARVLTIAKSMGDKLGLKMAQPLQKPLRVADLRAAMNALAGNRFEVDAAAIRKALDNKEFVLYYQPLINLRWNKLIGWEALARWQHPERGLVPPDRFIPVAEKSDAMDDFTDYVLKMALSQIAQWKDLAELRNGFVSINLAAGNLADAGLPDRLERLCGEYGVRHDLVRFELTETAAMSDAVTLLEVLTRLRVKGFKLAIDDFGTGYSSLLQLHRLPFSELKVDQNFVRTMESSEEAAVIVNAIIGLGHALRLELVAEGVETESIAKRLADAGCEIAQGYHFGRPMPPKEIASWCSANSRLMNV